MAPEDAVDEIMAAFKAAWDANAAAVAGSTPAVQWDTVDEASVPSGDTTWARIVVAHHGGGQRTIGRAGNGAAVFERTGDVVVQVFAAADGGVTLARKLAKIALDAFEGKSTPGGVTFRGGGLRDVGPDGTWVQCNAVAGFAYDEIK